MIPGTGWLMYKSHYAGNHEKMQISSQKTNQLPGMLIYFRGNSAHFGIQDKHGHQFHQTENAFTLPFRNALFSPVCATLFFHFSRSSPVFYRPWFIDRSRRTNIPSADRSDKVS